MRIGGCVPCAQAPEVAASAQIAAPTQRAMRCTVVIDCSSCCRYVLSANFANFVYDAIAQYTDACYFHFAHVAGFHPYRRLPREADSRRRAADDDVAGEKSHRIRTNTYQRRDVEDHVARIGVLQFLPVEPCAQLQTRRAGGKLVSGDELGAEGPRGVEVLAHHPLRRFELVLSNRAVVEEPIAGHVVEGALLRDVASGFADDDD